MKSLKLLPFAAAALFPLQAMGMMSCMPPADEISATRDSQIFPSPNQHIAFAAPVNEAEAEALLVKLKPALTAFEIIREQATLNLQETEISAAGTLIAAIRAETVTQDARKTLDAMSAEYSAAQADINALKAQPESQENMAEIEAMEWEIGTLSHVVEGARQDLALAVVALQDAQSINSDADSALAQAGLSLVEVEKANDMVSTKIARVEAEKIDAQQGYGSAFEIASGLDGHAPNDTKSSKNRCSNGYPQGAVSVGGSNS